MKLFNKKDSEQPSRINNEVGAAIAELALSCLVVILFIVAIIEFGRVLVLKQMCIISAREAVNIAARGGNINQIISAVQNSTSLLDVTNKGQIIITRVFKSGVVFSASQSKFPAQQRIDSRIAKLSVANEWNLESVPSEVTALLNSLPATHAAYFAEIATNFTPLTPLGKLFVGLEIYGVVFYVM